MHNNDHGCAVSSLSHCIPVIRPGSTAGFSQNFEFPAGSSQPLIPDVPGGWSTRFRAWLIKSVESKKRIDEFSTNKKVVEPAAIQYVGAIRLYERVEYSFVELTYILLSLGRGIWRS